MSPPRRRQPPKRAAARKAAPARRATPAKRAAPTGRAAAARTGQPPRRPSGPRGLGGDQVEGRQAVRELLIAGKRRVNEVLLSSDAEDAPVLRDIAELAADLRVQVRQVSRNRLHAEARTDAPQGVIARAAPLEEADVDDLVRPRGRTQPFLVVVDGVTDPGNLGALLRTCDCAGVTGVVLPRHRAVHVTPAVTKAAAGAVEHLPMALVGGVPAALARLRDQGIWVVGLDEGGPTSLFDLTLADEPVALVLGAEGAGLSRLARQRCDVVASIPIQGHLASLNVSVAGALACYEVVRRRSGS